MFAYHPGAHDLSDSGGSCTKGSHASGNDTFCGWITNLRLLFVSGSQKFRAQNIL